MATTTGARRGGVDSPRGNPPRHAPSRGDLQTVDPVKVDLKKTLGCYRAKRGTFDIVDVPAMHFLMIDGAGDPNTSPDYAAALQALYPIAYKLKFASKRELGRDYVVPPLEGLWWADDLRHFTSLRDKSQWRWTMMLATPDWIERDLVDAVSAGFAASPPERLADVRWELFDEGRCVQTLHVGPFDDEGPVLAHMHDEFVPAHGLRMTGTHHEIYLSDPRKTAPERLRTILRQPVVAAGGAESQVE